MKELDNKTTDKIIKIIDIYDKYLPQFLTSQNYRCDVINTIRNNPEYHDSWLGFMKLADETKLRKDFIMQTLMHDIGGLMSSDEHFVPRIAGHEEHLNNNK
tara:strand:- start:3308 stop:3610 length:303 start_codon:yes stop_codon:yes gene_type:complete